MGSHQLATVRKRFENWRQVAGRGHPIPEELWKAAVELVGSASPHSIAKALRLEPGKFRLKIKEYAGSHEQSVARKPKTTFVELSTTPVGARSWPMAGAIDQAAAILERSDGTRLKLYPEALREMRVTELLRSFLGTEAIRG
jgi:hypothetical protein